MPHPSRVRHLRAVPSPPEVARCAHDLELRLAEPATVQFGDDRGAIPAGETIEARCPGTVRLSDAGVTTFANGDASWRCPFCGHQNYLTDGAPS